MKLIHINRHSAIARLITTFMIVVFLFSDIVWAQGGVGISRDIHILSTDLSPIQTLCINLKDLSIPENLGKIKEIWNNGLGQDKRLVLHIQDSHANYEAQGNIAKILEHIINKYRPASQKPARRHFKDNGNNNGNNHIKTPPVLIAMEGAKGGIDTSMFHRIPFMDIRDMLADYFMGQGIINGVEYFDAMTGDRHRQPPFLVWGIEDKEVYIENVKYFKKVQETKGHVKEFADKYLKSITRLIEHTWSEEQKEYYRNYYKYQDDQMGLEEYAVYLKSKTRFKSQIPNFKNLIMLITLKNHIDFNRIEDERMDVLKELKDRMANEDFINLITDGLHYQTGDKTAVDYFLRLKRLMGIYYISRGRFKNLYRYFSYIKIEDRIDRKLLFSEIKAVEKWIAERLFNKESAKGLFNELYRVIILKKFTELKIYRDDLEYYKGHREEFVSPYTSKNGDNIRIFLDNFEKFCDLGIRRDSILVGNMLTKMEEIGTDMAVLITGGFHTDGMMDILKEEQADYAVISPKMLDVGDKNRYVQLILDKKNVLEKILAFTGTRLAIASALFTKEGDKLGGCTIDAVNKKLNELLIPLLTWKIADIEKEVGEFSIDSIQKKLARLVSKKSITVTEITNVIKEENVIEIVFEDGKTVVFGKKGEVDKYECAVRIDFKGNMSIAYVKGLKSAVTPKMITPLNLKTAELDKHWHYLMPLLTKINIEDRKKDLKTLNGDLLSLNSEEYPYKMNLLDFIWEFKKIINLKEGSDTRYDYSAYDSLLRTIGRFSSIIKDTELQHKYLLQYFSIIREKYPQNNSWLDILFFSALLESNGNMDEELRMSMGMLFHFLWKMENKYPEIEKNPFRQLTQDDWLKILNCITNEKADNLIKIQVPFAYKEKNVLTAGEVNLFEILERNGLVEGENKDEETVLDLLEEFQLLLSIENGYEKEIYNRINGFIRYSEDVWNRVELKGYPGLTDAQEPVYVISGIHGSLMEVRDILEHIGLIKKGEDKSGRSDEYLGGRLIILGDMIGRGPDSVQCVEYLKRLKIKSQEKEEKLAKRNPEFVQQLINALANGCFTPTSSLRDFVRRGGGVIIFRNGKAYIELTPSNDVVSAIMAIMEFYRNKNGDIELLKEYFDPEIEYDISLPTIHSIIKKFGEKIQKAKTKITTEEIPKELKIPEMIIRIVGREKAKKIYPGLVLFINAYSNLCGKPEEEPKTIVEKPLPEPIAVIRIPYFQKLQKAAGSLLTIKPVSLFFRKFYKVLLPVLVLLSLSGCTGISPSSFHWLLLFPASLIIVSMIKDSAGKVEYTEITNTIKALLEAGTRKNIIDTDCKWTDEDIEKIGGFIGNRLYEKEKRTISVNEKQITYNLIAYSFTDEIGRFIKNKNIAGAFNIMHDGKYYIFLEKVGEGIREEEKIALEHEEFELYRIEALKGQTLPEEFDIQRAAHILAWAMQILNNGWGNVSECTFIKEQLEKATIEQLAGIYNPQDKRKSHRQIIEEYLGIEALGKITKFEESVQEYALVDIISKGIEGKPGILPVDAYFAKDNLPRHTLVSCYIYQMLKDKKSAKVIDELMGYFDGSIKEDIRPVLEKFVGVIASSRKKLEPIPVIIDIKVLENEKMKEIISKILAKANQKEPLVAPVFVQTMADADLPEEYREKYPIVKYSDILNDKGEVDAEILKDWVIKKFSKKYRIESANVLKNSYLFIMEDNRNIFSGFNGIINAVIVEEKAYPLSYEVMNIGAIKRMVRDLRIKDKELLIRIIIASRKVDKKTAEEWATIALEENDHYLKQATDEQIKEMQESKKTVEYL